MRRIKASELVGIKLDMLKAQKGRCPLCGYRMRRLDDACLDHDHSTGALRSVVCRNCNAMEGKIFNCIKRARRDNTPMEWLENLRNYWILHAENQHGLLHHTHKTEEEKRIRRNKRATARRKAKKEGLL